MKPSKQEFCKFLADTGFELSCVIDVGILTDTPELRTNFQHVKQILIEPQVKYFDVIRKKYKNNNYELLNIGCDEKPGELFLHERSTHGGGGLPTHNSLKTYKSSKTYTSSTIVKVDTLNNISKDINEWILLKIDVDGKEVDILKGGIECLKKCAFVIIEATAERFQRIVDIMYDNDFSVFGIVDICYLKNSFWQCDLVFINNTVKPLHNEFDPEGSWTSEENIFAKEYRPYNPR